MKIAIYPGSFDPVTKGHLDIIERSSNVFDKVIVGVLNNSSKQTLFTTAERVTLLKMATHHLKNVEVESFCGLMVEFAELKRADIVVKGVRNVSDFEYEFQLALLNKTLKSNIETVFMMTDGKYSYISSSMVKEVARWGGAINELVPTEIIENVKSKFR